MKFLKKPSFLFRFLLSSDVLSEENPFRLLCSKFCKPGSVWTIQSFSAYKWYWRREKRYRWSTSAYWKQMRWSSISRGRQTKLLCGIRLKTIKNSSFSRRLIHLPNVKGDSRINRLAREGGDQQSQVSKSNATKLNEPRFRNSAPITQPLWPPTRFGQVRLQRVGKFSTGGTTRDSDSQSHAVYRF